MARYADPRSMLTAWILRLSPLTVRLNEEGGGTSALVQSSRFSS